MEQKENDQTVNEENELLPLSQYALFCPDEIPDICEKEYFPELAQCFLDTLPKDVFQLQRAYLQENWKKVDFLVDKLKEEGLFIAAKRLQRACSQFEQCPKENNQDLTELYQQLLTVIEDTALCVKFWLDNY